MTLAGLAFAALAATPLSTPAPAPEPPPMASMLSPRPALSFVDGPALDDPALPAWLAEQEARGTPLQLPVVVDVGPFRLGIQRAWLGTNLDGPAAGDLLLDLDDTTMSVGLMDRLRTTCPTGERCAVWIEARWGAPVPMPAALAAFDEGPRGAPVTVRGLVGVAAAGARHVRVAVPAP